MLSPLLSFTSASLHSTSPASIVIRPRHEVLIRVVPSSVFHVSFSSFYFSRMDGHLFTGSLERWDPDMAFSFMLPSLLSLPSCSETTLTQKKDFHSPFLSLKHRQGCHRKNRHPFLSNTFLQEEDSGTWLQGHFRFTSWAGNESGAICILYIYIYKLHLYFYRCMNISIDILRYLIYNFVLFYYYVKIYSLSY